MCVTELVRDIYNKRKQAFNGTSHQDSCFYHDTLSQMPAKLSTMDEGEGLLQRTVDLVKQLEFWYSVHK